MATIPLQVRFSDEDLAVLDAFRRSQQNPPSRASAVRQLFRRGADDASANKVGNDSRQNASPTGEAA
jgi:hypothetical protein